MSEVYFRRTQPQPDLEEGRRRLQAKIDLAAQGRARARASRSPTTARAGASRGRLAGGSAADPEARGTAVLRRHLQRAVRHAQRPDAARHHGARIHAGLPGAGPAAARRAGLRLRQVGAGIPRRPRHRALRHLRHQRLPARLRHVLLQAVRRRAPRLGRPVRLGRAHDRRTTGRTASTRSDQDAHLLRPALVPARDRDRAPLPAAAHASRSASAPTSPTTSATSRSTSCSR